MPRSRIAEYMVILFLIFNCFPHRLHYFTFPLAVHMSSNLAIFSPTLVFSVSVFLFFFFYIVAILMGVKKNV